MRTVEEQLAKVLSAARTRVLPTQRMALTEALGATLAEDVQAVVSVPGFDNSAMDGFAVRYADVSAASADNPVTLSVIADIPAGSAADPHLEPGQAARIMTGAPVPTTADAIVPFEDTRDGLADSLTSAQILAAPSGPGAFIRRRGADVARGQHVLASGTVLGPWQLSALTAVGVSEVQVSTRPRVAIISTGSELVEVATSPDLAAGNELPRGMIPESNGILLAGLCAEAGAEVVAQFNVDDDGPGLRTALQEVVGPGGADVVIFSGGVSAGAYEVVKTELSGQMEFTRVAMQPGKPQGFGADKEGGPLLFGLPGNPVSVAVSFEVFVRPALAVLQGRTALARPVLQMPAVAGWRSVPGRRQYIPIVLDRTPAGDLGVRPATAGGSGSHLAAGLGLGEGLAVVPQEQDFVAAGELLPVILMS